MDSKITFFPLISLLNANGIYWVHITPLDTISYDMALAKSLIPKGRAEGATTGHTPGSEFDNY